MIKVQKLNTSNVRNKIPNRCLFLIIKKNVFLLMPIKNDINQAHTKRLGNKAKLHLDAKSKP